MAILQADEERFFFDHSDGTLKSLEGLLPSGADLCFYCGKPSGYPLVYWHELGTNVVLHPECALSFQAHLAKDALLAPGTHRKVLSECPVSGVLVFSPFLTPGALSIEKADLVQVAYLEAGSKKRIEVLVHCSTVLNDGKALVIPFDQASLVFQHGNPMPIYNGRDFVDNPAFNEHLKSWLTAHPEWPSSDPAWPFDRTRPLPTSTAFSVGSGKSAWSR